MLSNSVVFWVIVFLVSLYALIKASDIFVAAAAKAGHSLGISPFLIGITVVGLGTSLPELVSSIIAVSSGSSEIVVGNVVGSNVANLLFVLGASALVKKRLELAGNNQKNRFNLSYLLGSAFFITLIGLNGSFSRLEGLFCTAGLFLYLTILFRQFQETYSNNEKRNYLIEWMTIGSLLLSPLFIYLGAKYTIEAVINLSQALKIGTEVIAVSAIAIGTSLPELVVSLSAGKKGKEAIAIGNIIGSNIFNSLAVIGIPALISPLRVTPKMVYYGLPATIVVSLLFLFLYSKKSIGRLEGILLLVLYAFFLTWLIIS